MASEPGQSRAWGSDRQSQGTGEGWACEAGLTEEAEQKELLVGFGEEGVWHLGRWEAL